MWDQLTRLWASKITEQPNLAVSTPRPGTPDKRYFLYTLSGYLITLNIQINKLWLAQQGRDAFTKAEKAHSLTLFYEKVWSLTQGQSSQPRIIKGRKHMSRVSSALTAALLVCVFPQAFACIVEKGNIYLFNKGRDGKNGCALREQKHRSSISFSCVELHWFFAEDFTQNSCFHVYLYTVRRNWEVSSQREADVIFFPSQFSTGLCWGFKQGFRGIQIPPASH